MKVAVLILSYNRFELLKKTLSHNIKNAGYEFDLYVWDNGSTDDRVLPYLRKHTNDLATSPVNMGIARPFNRMMKWVFDKDYDAVVFMANDIKEPANWLAARVKYMQRIPNSGMVSVALHDHGYRPQWVNGVQVHPGHVIGQFMISRHVFEKIGYFREDFGHYGPIDNDYNVRCDRAGFISYYVPGLKGTHLDDKDDKKYGYSKSEKIRETWQQFADSISRYDDPANLYIPFNE